MSKRIVLMVCLAFLVSGCSHHRVKKNGVALDAAKPKTEAELLAECILRHGSEPSFKSAKQAERELESALKDADQEKLSRILSCHTMFGLPYSEYDTVYNPERLALIVVTQRKKGHDILPLESTSRISRGRHYLLTVGYADNEARLFQLAMLDPGGSWWIEGVVQGDRDLIERMISE